MTRSCGRNYGGARNAITGNLAMNSGKSGVGGTPGSARIRMFSSNFFAPGYGNSSYGNSGNGNGAM
jgi:hypothetical protein